MKPIPAIDEAGNWIEAELTNGAHMTLMAISHSNVASSYAITLQGEYGVRVPPDIFKDWPAVRERVERARKARETALQHAAEIIQQDIAAQHGACPRPKRPSFARAPSLSTRCALATRTSRD